MQHTINETKIRAAWRGDGRCGANRACIAVFCLATCPTYSVLGEEMDSPRGRIYLMKEVLEENISAAEAQPYIDRCLGCMGCLPSCPSGVRYGDLLTSYRALTEPQRERSTLDKVARKMIIETLPHPPTASGRRYAAAKWAGCCTGRDAGSIRGDAEPVAKVAAGGSAFAGSVPGSGRTTGAGGPAGRLRTNRPRPGHQLGHAGGAGGQRRRDSCSVRGRAVAAPF